MTATAIRLPVLTEWEQLSLTAFGLILEQVTERYGAAEDVSAPLRISSRESGAPSAPPPRRSDRVPRRDAGVTLLRRLEHRALTEGEWRPYLTYLRVRAGQHVRERIPFRRSFALLAPPPELVMEAVRTEEEPGRLRAVLEGLECFREIVTTALVEAYLEHEAERVRHQERELLRLGEALALPEEEDGELLHCVASDLRGLLHELPGMMESVFLEVHPEALPSRAMRNLRRIQDRLDQAVRLVEALPKR